MHVYKPDAWASSSDVRLLATALYPFVDQIRVTSGAELLPIPALIDVPFMR
ncbi:MAG: hypothetical protein K2Z81_16350 [Cyanobacteria bacterium]|nr:hypothetical protein [Cyanobacteriota bacterium]